ncbi:homocysteine S-methyltransferase family protein [Staphylococcus aureus]
MGTILYSEGLDTCPEAYNLSHPDKVERIHRLSMLKPVLILIQPNTYGANFEKLKQFGSEDKVKAIHQATIIAKKAANKDTYILGTSGG